MLLLLKGLLLWFLFTHASSHAAQPEFIEDDLQLWTPVFLETPTRHKFYGTLEVSPRLGENVRNMTQLIIRPSLSYKLSKSLSLTSGYAWVNNWVPQGNDIQENRLWQQIQLQNNLAKLVIVNRTRLEERFIEDTNHASIRLRHQLRLTYPLGKGDWYVTSFDELFVNLNSTQPGPRSGVDQNRIFAGVGRKLSPSTRLEGGYQLQYINRLFPIPERINHVILLSLYHML